MNNNQMPFGYPGPFPNNNCNCRQEINDLQRKINHLENRINRLENMIYSNNYNNYGNSSYGNTSFLNSENRNYTTTSYML